MTSTHPQATIVVTTCDRPDQAARAVRSAMSQTERAIEILVVDDGTREPVSLAATEDRVRVIRTGGRVGVSKARNLGLAGAKGEWVTFLDDDDELLPHMIEASLAAARASSLPAPVAVVSGMEEVGPDGRTTITRLPIKLPRGRHYVLEDLEETDRRGLAAYNTLLAPVDVLRGLDGFDEEMGAWMHLDLMLRLNSICSIEAVRRVGYRMYHHAKPRLSRQHLLRAVSMMRTYQKHRELFRQHPGMHAIYLGRMGIMFLRSGRWRRPIFLTSRAILLAPRKRALKQLLMAIGGPRLFAWSELRHSRRRARDLAPYSLD